MADVLRSIGSSSPKDSGVQLALPTSPVSPPASEANGSPNHVSDAKPLVIETGPSNAEILAGASQIIDTPRKAKKLALEKANDDNSKARILKRHLSALFTSQRGASSCGSVR